MVDGTSSAPRAARRAPADARRRTHFEFVVRSLKSFACFAAANGYQQKLNQNIKLNFATGAKSAGCRHLAEEQTVNVIIEAVAY